VKRFVLGFMFICACALFAMAAEVGSGQIYSVIEIDFNGPEIKPNDSPAKDIDFWVRFQHESGSPEYKIHGFWDGDGKGGATGKLFKIRFSPTKIGKWKLVEVYSNKQELAKQRQGDYVTATASKNRGFWMVDSNSNGSRWFMRSDGSHQYVIGNTQYSFLSGYGPENRPSGSDIATDIKRNAEYFKKLRFSLHGDRYAHPTDKPFLDNEGKPTDIGDFSHRPNPKWFQERVDLAVKEGFSRDFIVDLILGGPDVEYSRATLRARHNNGDPTPWLKYIAARYGSYPNVWICLANEYDIFTPCKNADPKADCTDIAFTTEKITQFGKTMKGFLPYPTPLSVHSSGRGFLVPEVFNKDDQWATHVIIQKKQKTIPIAADTINKVWTNGGKEPRNKPTVNDELSYQGAGDKHLEEDTIESHFGAFLGGGYGSTGYKSGNKLGHYFAGNFNPNEHTSADNLLFLRDVIDKNITFWKMTPDISIFSNSSPNFRGLAWEDNEYILGSNKAHKDIVANLPSGEWTVHQYDIISKESKTLSKNASGKFTFSTPQSRAVLFHFQKNGSKKQAKLK
jgi:hypothetical protein